MKKKRISRKKKNKKGGRKIERDKGKSMNTNKSE